MLPAGPVAAPRGAVPARHRVGGRGARGLPAVVALAVVLGCALAGCTTGPSARPAGTAQAPEANAERLAREGQPAAAAQSWEQAAGAGRPETRAAALTNAVRQWLAAARPADAERVLARLDTEHPANAAPTAAPRALLRAEVALAAGRPARALEQLRGAGDPPPATLEPAASTLRARALIAQGRVADGVRAFETGTRGQVRTALEPHRRALWDSLRAAALQGRDLDAPRGADPVVIGWLELARIAVAGARNPAAVRPRAAAWRNRYASHPANGTILDGMLAEADRSPALPARVALLLPLSGRMEPAGTALRDGFMAAWYRAQPSARPELRVYDTGTDAADAYRRAVADGAAFVVGPLAKEDVQAVARSADPRVVTLALNVLPDGEPVPRRFYQYALAPEDEARQVAERLVAQGLRVGAALVPSGEWGRRVVGAFEAALREGGGVVVASRAYSSGTSDFSDEITQALGFADSERRYRQLVATLGTPLQFSPRRRDDLQFLFVAGQPVQGRLIRPQLKFHFAGDLPVYSISDIYDPNPAANEDLDGLVFPDMPWTLAQDPDTTQLRETLARTWPQAVRRRGRLYAMGFDAFRLVEHLETGERSGDATAAPVSTHAGDPIAGLTGRLTVGPDGRIRRTLDWAAIGPDGRPRPLPSVVIAP
jgi:outer membrane PBP1 activator LpoA protein